ncbi:VCBS repeat-containing protein [Winogradskyella poriferorum]|uniref:VCBS repeat-containing protein n=1 Tax=Winogradskyella poriferorum TaxID=307627 RepID=UPI003D649C33
MKKKFNKSLIKVFTLYLLVSNCNDQPIRDLNPSELTEGFKLLSPEQTGIDFNNKINETPEFNHFYFSQIYSGSGVAIGDINNDGLSDVFFGGNQVNDRLYLNKGNLKFEDITKSSKIARKPGWTWGVTMVDINSDGYLDIYMSRNGNSIKLEDRSNLLYINNQDLTFTESAQKYGLADVGFSSQAIFFDMDNDGDLDMYQVNQPADAKLFLIHDIPKKDYKFFGDRLYENINGKFKNITENAGLIGKTYKYGLGVCAGDLNNDGWTDLYVTNDYEQPDLYLLNNKDKTFTNVINDKMKHISFYSMGIDINDINNDGQQDVLTIDMTPSDHYRSKVNMPSMDSDRFYQLVNDGSHYQYMKNALQVNVNEGEFSDISNQIGISRTDWSWSGLMQDFNNDGFKDIIISNGVKYDLLNNDYKASLVGLKDVSVDHFFELSKKAPKKKIGNQIFVNKGDYSFKDSSKDWSFDTPTYSSGMAYGDLDNDGDLDIVINNMEDYAHVYENTANGNFIKINFEGSDLNTIGIGAKVVISYDGEQQVAEHYNTRGYFSAVEPGLFFGLGKTTLLDKVEVIWSNGTSNVFENVQANRVVTAKYSDAKPYKKDDIENNRLLAKVESKDFGIDYKHQENYFDEYVEEILLPHNISQNGPFAEVADINNDGLDDLFIGGAMGQSGVLYIQNGSGAFTLAQNQPWAEDKASEDLGCLFFDVDNDGDVDLYVTSGGSEYKHGDKNLIDRLYINDGNGQFKKSQNALPKISASTQCVKASDIDNDGDLDLFIGTRVIPGRYAFPADSYILLNENGKFSKANSEIAPDLKNIGMVTDAVFTDINKDGNEDLMIVGEWMQPKVLLNTNGRFEDASTQYGLEDTRGIWWSITASDLDGDGDDDYILGNLGKNNKFKATEEHPFKVYANDFDNNGTNDIVLAKFYKDDYVPVRGRECTSQQMPYVAEKFEDYHSFASSKLFEILPEDKVDEAVMYEIKSFESVVLFNDSGSLVRKTLPNQAQFSPIKSSIVKDVNGDGIKDIIIAGNHFGVEVETTRYDAGFGSVLIGSDEGSYTPLTPSESGFYVPNDSRNLKTIKIGSKELLLVTNNNSKIELFELKS